MTSDNKDNKETFESKCEECRNYCIKRGILIPDLNLFFRELKQIRDKEIKDEIEKAFQNDELVNNWINEKVKEKDNQIEKLKQEVVMLEIIKTPKELILTSNKERDYINNIKKLNSKISFWKSKSEELQAKNEKHKIQRDNLEREFGKLMELIQTKYPNAWKYYTDRLIPTKKGSDNK